MAGPCVRILLPKELSRQDLIRVEELIACIASRVEGKDFWIAGQPFLWFREKAEDEERELVIFGFSPVDTIHYCAMTNDYAAHVLLAAVAHRTAEMFEGAIAIDGSLNHCTNDVSVLTFEGKNGRVTTDLGWDALSPSCLRYWLGHPEFRLIK